jgi:Fur family peroxide stress response transcriptional regulator
MHRARKMIQTLRERGLRITAQRIALVEAFANDESHPTAQDLFERLRGAFPTMSFATVYNTLDALAQAGLSSTLRVDGGAARFDPNTSPHHHAVCDGCGATFDIPARSLEPDAAAQSRTAEVAPGFVVARVEKTYRGTCRKCSGKKKEN